MESFYHSSSCLIHYMDTSISKTTSLLQIIVLTLAISLLGLEEGFSTFNPADKENLDFFQMNSLRGNQNHQPKKRKGLADKDTAGLSVQTGDRKENRGLKKVRTNPNSTYQEASPPSLQQISPKSKASHIDTSSKSTIDIIEKPIQPVFDTLPPELIQHIFSFLSPEDVANVAILSNLYNANIKLTEPFKSRMEINTCINNTITQLNGSYEDKLQELKSLSFFRGEAQLDKVKLYKELFIIRLQKNISASIVDYIPRAKHSFAASWWKPCPPEVLSKIWVYIAFLELLNPGNGNKSNFSWKVEISKLELDEGYNKIFTLFK